VEAALEARGLTVRYGSVEAVRGLSLSVAFGEVLGLLGPNGAGKTSTVEALEGYRRPAGGELQVLGVREPWRAQRELASSVGVMLQEGGVPPRMRVEEAIRLYAAFYDKAWPIDDLLERLDLAEVARTPFRRLSGGEKQRLLLALAIVGRPRVLFLDEPTAGVDPVGKQAIRSLVAELAADGVAILLTGHELEEIDRMVDRVLIIDQGRAVAEGTPAELRERYGEHGLEFSVEGPVDVAALAERLGVEVRRLEAGRLRVVAPPTPDFVATLGAVLVELGVRAGPIETVESSLESIYLKLLAKERSA
jgi:ABC-2 type transport system ATP-binding protein